MREGEQGMVSRPDVLLGADALSDFARGFCEMAELAAVTYGPRGGHVAHLAELRKDPELLTDAATITRRIIELPGKARDMGAMLARHFIWRVRQEVGDGSALAAILARAMVQEATRLMAAGYNPQLLRRGIEKGVEAACRALEQMATPLAGEEDYVALATALTGNAALGRVIGEAVDLVGADGAVTIEEYAAPYLDREYVEGARLPWGLISPYLETDEVAHEAVLDNAYVFVTSNKLQSARDILPVIELVRKAEGKALFVIADQTQADALATLVVNHRKGDIRCAAVKVEALGENRVPSMEDVAILTGARIILANEGLSAADVRLEDLGRARRIVVRRKETIIAGGAGKPAEIRERIRLIRQQLRERKPSDDGYKPLRERLSSLSTGVAIIKIGAFGAKEREQLKELVENTLLVVSVSAQEGMVPGGGAALLAAVPAVRRVRARGDEAAGLQVVARALEEPMKQLARSAGEHPPLVVEMARRRGAGYGYDVVAGKVRDMRAAGIADPTKVVKAALRAAASAVSMLITTEALVLHRKPATAVEP